MKKANLNQFIVESLKPKHIVLLRTEENLKYSENLERKIIINWFSEIQGKFREYIPQKQSKYIIAKDQSKLLGLLTLNPINRKGSCFRIKITIFDDNLGHHSSIKVSEEMILFALQMNPNHIFSWIVKCSTDDIDNISLMRKLGFQTFKIYKRWGINKELGLKQVHNQTINSDITWQLIDRKSAPLLLRLENASHPILLRQLLDRSYLDILDKNNNRNGVLIAKRDGQTSVLAALINSIFSNNKNQLEFIRDFAWDNRIEKVMQAILYNLALKNNEISIETSLEDENLANLLNEIGFQYKDETILLGKSIWRRRVDPSVLAPNTSLDSLIESLNPNQRPLPSPFD